jgi:hypothetical protein
MLSRETCCPPNPLAKIKEYYIILCQGVRGTACLPGVKGEGTSPQKLKLNSSEMSVVNSVAYKYVS